MNDKELALINQRAVDLVDPENRSEAGVDLLTNDVFRLLNENDRLRKALEKVEKLLFEGKYECYYAALNVASQALEPAKGEDERK